MKNSGPVLLLSLSNAWEVQASPGDSSGFGDCCCGGTPSTREGWGVSAGPLLPVPAAKGSQASSSFLTGSLEVTGCQEWVPGQECLEGKGSTDSSISGSHSGQAGARPAPAPLSPKPSEKSKGWRERSTHSWCLFKALIPAQMIPVLCVPTAPSCPEETSSQSHSKGQQCPL